MANLPAEETTTDRSESRRWAWFRGGKRKPKSQNLAARRNHPVRRLLRFVRSILPWAILATIVFRAYQDPEFLNIVLNVLAFGFRLVFAIIFVVIQFGAIFWFMSRTKVETIRPGDPKTLTFEDYKGQDNLLKLVKQWISLLSDRSKFKEMGGEFINGLMLYGPPGTGKTLLAKVMAGEAGVAFISIEGSGFRAMFWGVDVLRMIWFISKARKLAREYGACIAYIDEIDAVGMSRGGVMGGQGQNRVGMGGMGSPFMGGTGALTRLLYEMDGVGEQSRSEKLRARIYRLLKKPIPPRNWHVLFMGSTNRPDVLDPALTRPGRFDRTLEVGKPDRSGRREIIQYYLDKVKSDESVDIEAIVADTTDYTPAQIMSAITKDAVRLALFDGRDRISQRDIDLAFQEQRMGLENPIEEMEEDQREQVAYHEAGHAVASYLLRPESRIVRATIIRRAGALGYVMKAESYEIYSYPLNRIVRDIMVSLSGDVATKIHTGEAWSGTGSDFNHVRNALWALAVQGYFGPPVSDPNTIYQDEMKRFWVDAERKTEHLLRLHWSEVEAIADALLERNDLTGREVVEIIQQATAEKNGEVFEPEEVLEGAEPIVVSDTPTPNGDETIPEREPTPEELPENQPAAD